MQKILVTPKGASPNALSPKYDSDSEYVHFEVQKCPRFLYLTRVDCTTKDLHIEVFKG